MKLFDRLILFITSFSLMFVTLVIILVGIGLFNQAFIDQMLYEYMNVTDVKMAILIISTILFIMTLYIMAKSLQRKKITPIRKQSEIGEIKISMETLENLVTKITSRVKGVRELKAKVKPEEDGSMAVLVKIVFDGETPIPQITKEIQDNVKERLEEITGIQVGQVHVVVSNVSQPTNKKLS